MAEKPVRGHSGAGACPGRRGLRHFSLPPRLSERAVGPFFARPLRVGCGRGFHRRCRRFFSAAGGTRAHVGHVSRPGPERRRRGWRPASPPQEGAGRGVLPPRPARRLLKQPLARPPTFQREERKSVPGNHRNSRVERHTFFPFPHPPPRRSFC